MRKPIKEFIFIYAKVNKICLALDRHPIYLKTKAVREAILAESGLDLSQSYTVKIRHINSYLDYGVKIFNRNRINPFKLLHNQLKKSRYNPNFIVVNPSVLGKIQFLGENGKLLPLATDEIYPTSQEMGECMEKLKEQN